MAKIPLAVRFWKSVDRRGPDNCWGWKLSHRQSGYGAFRGERRECWEAHRLAWILTHGAIPDGLFVLHRCDNRSCCNPNHLFLGTQQDNVDDMRRKHRHYVRHGVETGVARVTPRQVRAIRALYAAGGVTQKQIADQYGIGGTTVHSIVHRAYWAWVEDEVTEEEVNGRH